MSLIKYAYCVAMAWLLSLPLIVTVGSSNRDFVKDGLFTIQRPHYSQYKNHSQFIKDYYHFFEKYYFGRLRLLRLHNDVIFFCLHESPSPDRVLVGKDGHLFHSNNNIIDTDIDYNGFIIPDYQGFITLSQEFLHTRYRGLLEFKKWLDTKHIKLLVAIVPDKIYVNHDKVPYYIHKGARTSTDQVVEFLNTNGIRCINLLPYMLYYKAKGYELYPMIDTHWNKLGAYIGYRAIIDEMSKDFGHISLVNIDMSHITYTPYSSMGDIYYSMRISSYPYYRDASITFPVTYKMIQSYYKDGDSHIITVGKKGLPRATIYRDSMGFVLLPVLSNSLSYARYIWRFKPDTIVFDKTTILQDNPDYIIIQIAERVLKSKFIHCIIKD